MPKTAVLNGGMQAWASAKLPQDNVVPQITASKFTPTLDKRYIATRDEVAEKVKSGNALLVDARPAAFFQGETKHAAAKQAGTLKGAVNVEHSRWFAPGSTAMMSVPEAQKAAASTPLGKQPETETVAFCNTGHWAATNWFAQSEVLGQKNVKLYAGSMVDWTQDASHLPMDNVPGRMQQLKSLFK